MTFPQTALPIAVELNLAGTWTDVTSYVYSRDSISITRGRPAEAASADPGRCALTLNNRDGRFSPRNPTGAYYGQIGRNTQMRVSANIGNTYLATTGTTAGNTGASTPDAAALDITGDMDVRLDATLDNWTASGSVELAGKFLITGNQRSWLLMTRDGNLHFEMSAGGSSVASFDSTAPLPPDRRMAVRVTLHVDLAGGSTVTFYTAPSISGTWTQLGAPVVNTGINAVYNSTAPLRVGDGCGDLGYPSSSGKIWAFQLYNGIAGTLVANVDFTAQTPGATSFADTTGLTWTIGTNTTLSNRKTRFVGEVSEWPARWTTGGQDVWVPVQASGILRRLGQGATPLQSPMRREMSNPARTSIVAYWPCEDGASATELASAASGAPPLRITTTGVTPAAASPWASSDALPTMGAGTLRGDIPSYTSTGQTALRMFLRLPAAGLSLTQQVVSLVCTGTAVTWSVFADTTGQLDIRAYDSEGTQLFADGFHAFYTNGTTLSLGVELTENAGSVDWRLFAFDTTAYSFAGGVTLTQRTGTLASATVGRVMRVVIGDNAALGDTVIGHVAVSDATAAYTDTGAAIIGWAGETARNRAIRLAAEENLSLTTRSQGDDQLGPQRVDTLLHLLGQAADVGGTLYEQRDQVGLAFAGRDSLYNQRAAMALDYTVSGEVAPPLEPVDDDQEVVNDVAVQRDDAASSRAVLESGALSVLAPPNGIGRYNTSVSLNLFEDAQTVDQAAWRLHLGTWDEARYPAVSVNLATAAQLIDTACDVDAGDRVTIANLPAWLPPGGADLRVLGYTETLAQYTWGITYNCRPYGPWHVAVADADDYGRADTEGSELAAGVTSAATTMNVLTASGPYWTVDATQAPFDVTVGGEQVTVTAVASSVSDAFGRTSSSGWGTADTGQTWTASGGSASDYSVGSGVGKHSLTSVNVARNTVLPAPNADVEIRVLVSTSALAAGAAQLVNLVARYIDTDNHYQCRLQFDTSAGLNIALQKRVAAAGSQMTALQLPNLTHTAGGQFWVRFKVQGSSLYGKCWASSGAEPDWQVTTTDTSLTAAGSVGVRSQLNTGNTNTLPVTASFDSFEVLNPQTFTVTRSVNGITKAQSAATALSLTHPAFIAL